MQLPVFPVPPAQSRLGCLPIPVITKLMTHPTVSSFNGLRPGPSRQPTAEAVAVGRMQALYGS